MPAYDEPPRSRTYVLLVSGWAGAGKDTVAALTGYRRVAFADPLKRHVSEATGIPLSVFHSRWKDRPLAAPLPRYPTARTPRDALLQHALVARERDPDIYAREIATEIRDNPGIHHWVISDWRYRREYAFLRETLEQSDGFHLVRVRVERPGITPSGDPTEHDLEGEEMDIELDNDGTEEALAARVREKVIGRFGAGPPQQRSDYDDDRCIP
jgi:hypothetical protein